MNPDFGRWRPIGAGSCVTKQAGGSRCAGRDGSDFAFWLSAAMATPSPRQGRLCKWPCHERTFRLGMEAAQTDTGDRIFQPYLTVLLTDWREQMRGIRSYLVALGAVTCVAGAHADVVWSFAQVGGDVVATASGRFTLPQQITYGPFLDTDFFRSDTNGLYAMKADASDDAITGIYQGFPHATSAFSGFGTLGVFNFLDDADIGTGKFGHVGNNVFLDPNSFDSFPNNRTATVNASLTWFGQSIDGVLGAGVAMAGDPLTLWRQSSGCDSTAGNCQTITMVREAAAVPEPGSIALVGLALAGLGAVRRRKMAA